MTFPDLQDAQRNKCIQKCSPLIPSCELSRDHSAHVDWYKDGLQIQSRNNVELQPNILEGALVIPSAETSHGTYQCLTSDDTVTFKEDVPGDLYTLSLFIIYVQMSIVLCLTDTNRICSESCTSCNDLGSLSTSLMEILCRFLLLGRSPQIMPIPQSEKYKMVTVGCPIILQCEVSDASAQVSWFRDEVELYCKTGLDMKRNGTLRKLIVQSAKASDSGVYSCRLIDDVVTFHVDVEGDFLTNNI